MGTHVWRWIGLMALVLVATTDIGFAQTTGTFNGRVVDQNDAVLPGATVTGTNVDTGVARTTVTNNEGVYSLAGLVPGVYNVSAALTGFQGATRERVTLPVNTTLTLDFKMG